VQRKIIVFATSFLDNLLTNPPEEGKAVKDLEEAAKQAYITVDFKCDRNPSEPLTQDEIEGAVAIIADLEVYSRELLLQVGPQNGGTLRLISRYGIGYNNIDIEAASEAGIAVCNTPGANALPTAEWAVSTLMAVAGRRIPHHERASRGLKKTGPSRLDLSGKTLGIIGTGNIGKNVSSLLKGYNMKIVASDLYPDNQWAKNNNATYTDIPTICREADFITLHASGGKQIITRELIGLMKNTTALINCARGVLVDNEAVYEAVKEGTLWGYGIDELWEYKNLPVAGLNIAVSPHVGSDTDQGKLQMQLMSTQAVIDFIKGKEPLHIVNKGAVK